MIVVGQAVQKQATVLRREIFSLRAGDPHKGIPLILVSA
jgi:hypothetical protein